MEKKHQGAITFAEKMIINNCACVCIRTANAA